VTKVPNGGQSLNFGFGSITVDSDMRMVSFMTKRGDHDETLNLDHGKYKEMIGNFSGGAQIKSVYEDGHIQSISLGGIDGHKSVTLSNDGTATVDGAPANSFDFQFTKDRREHLEFDADHKLTLLRFMGPEDDDTLSFRAGLPTREEKMLDSGKVGGLKFHEDGSISRLTTALDVGAAYLDFADGKVLGLTLDLRR